MDKPSNAAELLQRMVKIASVNTAMGGPARSENELGDYLFDLARAWNLQAQRLPLEGEADQILITVPATHDDAEWLLFDSHMDTVSVEGMTIDPFGGEIKDGKLFGRGSCDTKGTGAAMLWALRQHAKQTERAHHVALLFSVDEEHSMRGIRAFIDHDLPKLGWRPAAVIVGEPTELHPVISHNGLLRFGLTTQGVAAHSSVPHEGKSAISAMVKVIDALESQYIPSLEAEDTLTGRAACSINIIRGGAAANVIPDRCTITIDRRLVPGEDVEATLNDAANVIDATGEQVDRHISVQHPPMTTRYNEKIVALSRSVLREMNLPTMTLGVAFATHAAYFDEAAIASVVIGPGNANKAHTKDEYIELAQLELGVELYARLMRTT